MYDYVCCWLWDTLRSRLGAIPVNHISRQEPGYHGRSAASSHSSNSFLPFALLVPLRDHRARHGVGSHVQGGWHLGIAAQGGEAGDGPFLCAPA